MHCQCLLSFVLTDFSVNAIMINIPIICCKKAVYPLNILTLYTQIVVMFLLMAVGAVCYKRGIITDSGSAQMSSLIMTFVAPAIIIHSFCREFDPTMFSKLILSFLLSLLLLLVSILLATLLFRSDTSNYADKRMCVIFSNNGFMALPLLQALLGGDGVFIGSINIVVTNILLWTYGVHLLSHASSRASTAGGSGGMGSWKKIVFNPGTIGFYIGLAIFLTSAQLPAVLDNTIEFLSNLNTPLAMIVLGVYLAQSNLKEIIKDRAMYLVCACRLLIVPLLSIALLLLLPFDRSVTNVLIISISTPCAVASSMFAQMYGTNYRYSSRMIAFSTLLSAVSMPLMLSLYQMLAG